VWPNVELTGPTRQDGLARSAKMHRVPPTGPSWPAVAGPVERRVRRQRTLLIEAYLRVNLFCVLAPAVVAVERWSRGEGMPIEAGFLLLGRLRRGGSRSLTLVGTLLGVGCAGGPSSALAESSGWMRVSADGSRQVRAESLRTTRPIVSYLFRYVDSAGSPSVEPFGVEVDCIDMERRELPAGKARPGYTSQERQEMEYVCRWAMSHWNAGRASVESSDPSWWNIPKVAEAPVPRTPAPEGSMPFRVERDSLT